MTRIRTPKPHHSIDGDSKKTGVYFVQTIYFDLRCLSTFMLASCFSVVALVTASIILAGFGVPHRQVFNLRSPIGGSVRYTNPADPQRRVTDELLGASCEKLGAASGKLQGIKVLTDAERLSIVETVTIWSQPSRQVLTCPKSALRKLAGASKELRDG